MAGVTRQDMSWCVWFACNEIRCARKSLLYGGCHHGKASSRRNGLAVVFVISFLILESLCTGVTLDVISCRVAVLAGEKERVIRHCHRWDVAIELCGSCQFFIQVQHETL